MYLHFGVFTFERFGVCYFEHASHRFLVFLLLTLKWYMFPGIYLAETQVDVLL